jgi:hypothetical protein
MTYLQLGLLLGLGIISLLTAFFPRRLARSRRSPDPFIGFEEEWREIMLAKSGPAPSPCSSEQKDIVDSIPLAA